MASLRPDVAPSRAAALRARYETIRRATAALAAPLSAEDQLVQSMPEASPTKWHLAHTTWFFETFVLSRFVPAYRPFDERYSYLFNSYYEAVGPRPPRPQRGALTRPSAEAVRAYREAIDSGWTSSSAAMSRWAMPSTAWSSGFTTSSSTRS